MVVMHTKSEEEKCALEFGMKVCSDLDSLPARVQPPPMNMINGLTIDNWACLSFSSMPPVEVYRFCSDLSQTCNSLGMSVNPKPLVDIRLATPNCIENAVKDVHRRALEMIAKQGKGGQLQLLLVILPEFIGFTYGKIKKVCQTELGIVSECCLPWHASTAKKQYLEYVAHKISVKVGGCTTLQENPFVQNGTTLLSEVPIGVDATPSPHGEDSPSSAVVGSTDSPEITSGQPHMQEIIEDHCNVISDPQRVLSANLEEDVAQSKFVKETPLQFQAQIRVLDFKTITLMVKKDWTVQKMVSEAFLKCGGIYFHPRVIINGTKEAGLQDILSDFVEGEFSVQIIGRLLGGVLTYLGDFSLTDYLSSVRKTMFDVCTLPTDIHFAHMHPYFVSLGPPSIEITKQLLSLVLNRDNCLDPFDLDSLLYNRTEKRLYFHSDVGVRPFSETSYYQNLYDLGTILSQIFMFDENLVLSSSSSIHVIDPTPAQSWRLPPFVDLLVFDLQTRVRQFLPFSAPGNKFYFDTHMGHMSPQQRVKYLLCQELDTEYKGGENYLETVVGLVGHRTSQVSNPSTILSWENRANKALPFKNMFPQNNIPTQLPQNQPSQSSHNNPPTRKRKNLSAQVPLNPPSQSSQNNPQSWKRKNRPAQVHQNNAPQKRRRAYDFARIGALWSCGRNFVGHSKKPLAGCKISLKQAEAYLNLVFPGLAYHVRLRTSFKGVTVTHWHRSPKNIQRYRGPATAAIKASWCNNEFTDEEVLCL